MTGDGIGWWFMIVAVAAAAIPFLTIPQRRWWPSAWGWAIVLLGIGIGVSDNFRSWTAFVMATILVGLCLGFAGLLTGPNSPAK